MEELQMATQTKEKFVKYWTLETPEIITTDKNEVRIYAQHGKVQVYPIVQSAAQGIGKGATLNLDTFTTEELKSFSSLLDEVIENGTEGYSDTKKYWTEEDPTILSTNKNEVRFFPEHGKIQVYPKIETGRGIGRGATLNLEGIDYDAEASNIFDTINSIVEGLLEAPNFNQPAPSPVNVKAEGPKQQADPKMEKLTKLLDVLGGDSGKLEKLLALLDDEPIAQVDSKPVEEPKAKIEPTIEEKNIALRDKAIKEWSIKTLDEVIAYAVNGTINDWKRNRVVEAYLKGGDKEAVKWLKSNNASYGMGTSGFRLQCSGKGMALNFAPDRSHELTWKAVWEKFKELHPEALEVPEEEPVEEMEADDELDEDFGDEDAVMAEDIEAEASKDLHVDSVKSLTNEELISAYEKNTSTDTIDYNPALSIALFEEIKSRKASGKMVL
jgi:hypothetical protein